MPVELHLPDLPEVPISLGPTPGALERVAVPLHLRVRDAVSAYLPLLLMTLLALGTWWLVKNTPVASAPSLPAPVRSDPDYTMTEFAIERFDPGGRLRLRVEGDRLRHYPDTDRFEIESARIRAVSAQGQLTLASARRALGNGDLSEVQLFGGARVDSTGKDGQPLQMTSEFLHAFLLHERVSTHEPVQVKDGANVLQAAALDYDHATRKLELKGPLKATLSGAKDPQ